MSIELTSLILFAALFLVMALGVPFPFVTGGVAVVFTYLLWGSEALYLPAMQAFMTSTQITLLPLPLFILMASIMERSGVAEDLYSTLHEWFGSLRGGLAVGTVGLGTIFAAMAGGSMAGTMAMGLIALPAMLKRKYDSQLAQRPEVIAITKSELPGAEDVAQALASDLRREVLLISAVTGSGLPQLTARIVEQLDEQTLCK